MLLAGFDAGQTGTRCRISRWTDARWTHLATGEGQGVSHLDAPNGHRTFERALQCSLAAAVARADLKEEDLDAAVIGASGIEMDTPLTERAGLLMADTLGLPRTRVLATGDERTALRGAFQDSAGIVLISGTGMICIGRDEQGREQRCGGWGWLLDGAGSAFDIGHHGLQLSLKMADGRMPDHPLRAALWSQLSCSTGADVKALVVRPDFRSATLAALAPVVSAAAHDGLKEAQQILDRSADALAEAVLTVAQRLDLRSPQLAGHGGALSHLPPFRAAVEQALAGRLPQARWCTAGGDACDGALALARDLVLRPQN